jgi:hypothetical protein
MSYTDVVICIGPLPFPETWPPIYWGQERTARNRLKASQVHHHVYFRYTPCLSNFTFEFIRRPTSPILSPSSRTFVELILVSRCLRNGGLACEQPGGGMVGKRRRGERGEPGARRSAETGRESAELNTPRSARSEILARVISGIRWASVMASRWDPPVSKGERGGGYRFGEKGVLGRGPVSVLGRSVSPRHFFPFFFFFFFSDFQL